MGYITKKIDNDILMIGLLIIFVYMIDALRKSINLTKEGNIIMIIIEIIIGIGVPTGIEYIKVRRRQMSSQRSIIY
jgi:hypothetical protein